MKIFSSVSILNLYFFAFHFRSTIHLQFTFGDDVREESGLIFLPIWISVYWEDYIYCTTLFHKWRSICDLSSSWLCHVLMTLALNFWSLIGASRQYCSYSRGFGPSGVILHKEQKKKPKTTSCDFSCNSIEFVDHFGGKSKSLYYCF